METYKFLDNIYNNFGVNSINSIYKKSHEILNTILMGEKIVENKTCKNCQMGYSITDRDLEFYDKVSPVFA